MRKPEKQNACAHFRVPDVSPKSGGFLPWYFSRAKARRTEGEKKIGQSRILLQENTLKTTEGVGGLVQRCPLFTGFNFFLLTKVSFI